MGTALTMVELDSSNGILFPFYDEDTNVIYLCGKVRLFLVTAAAGSSAVVFIRVTPASVTLNIRLKHHTSIISVLIHRRILKGVSVPCPNVD